MFDLVDCWFDSFAGCRKILGNDIAGQNVLRHVDKSKVLKKPYRKMLEHKLCSEIVQKYGNR